MICLDTNYLIRGLSPGSLEEKALIAWQRKGKALFVPSIVWYEFLCGPVTETQILVIRSFLSNIISFEEAQAAKAAQLFNAVGRIRHLRIDSIIAATAIVANLHLATANKIDFKHFTFHGLKLI